MMKKDRALTFNQSNIPCDGSPFLEEEEEKKKGKKIVRSSADVRSRSPEEFSEDGTR